MSTSMSAPGKPYASDAESAPGKLRTYDVELEDAVLPSLQGSPLQVNTSPTFSGRRSQRAAVQQFRETGIAVEPPSAANLQAILDYCFKGCRDFTLNWTAKNGSWTVFHETRFVKHSLKWRTEDTDPRNEPTLLTTEIGIFRATLAKGQEGWRLQLLGTGETWELRSMDMRNAQAEAAWIIRMQMKQVLDTIGEPN